MNWETGEEDGSGWGGLLPDGNERKECDELTHLRAENERYRKALEWIANSSCHENRCECREMVARRALEGETK